MKIAVLDDYQNVSLELADWSGLNVTVFSDPLKEPASALKGFEIICIMRERTPFPRALFEQLPDLKLLVTTGKANAAIDLGAAKDTGVTVCGTRILPHPTAELTWGLILSLTRNIPQHHHNVRTGAWQEGLGVDVIGKKLGIIGLGKLGQQVARIGQAFGMEVLAWSRNLTEETAARANARRVEKESLFREADIISIHMRYSPEIDNLVGSQELSWMKQSAYLVNTSRAPIIDTAALVDSLKAGRIAGAALDVFDQEPLARNAAIRTCPNMILTPHIGYVSRENYEVFYQDTVAIIRDFIDGKDVETLN